MIVYKFLLIIILIFDLPPKNRSTLKLENLILWIKGGSNEQTKAFGGKDHQLSELVFL